MDLSTMVNVVTTQHRKHCAIISMNVYSIMDALMVQLGRFYASISMITFTMMNVLTMQRRRCCSFDSPGLARNEPTPGEHPQGDSTR